MFLQRLKVVIAALFLSLAVLAPVATQGEFGLKNDRGLSETGGRAGFKTGADNNLYFWIGRIVNAALTLIMIIFFALILYSGFRWMTARDNPEMVTGSKDTIRASIIGLIMVLASYAISSFVFKQLGG